MTTRIPTRSGLVAILVAFSGLEVANAQTTTRVSLSSANQQGNQPSYREQVSADGRFALFSSAADDLVPGDTNRAYDVFLRDRLLGTTTRVNVGPNGVEADGESSDGAISADGRFVAFSSAAANLVPNDINHQWDVFVVDLQSGSISLVSVDSNGALANGASSHPSISDDGSLVAFASVATNLVANDDNGVEDVFLHDSTTGTTTLVSATPGGHVGDRMSTGAALTGDGRSVAFASDATDLVSGDRNGWTDVFLRDLPTSTTVRVSVNQSGHGGDQSSWQPSISLDGRFVAFSSNAANLIRTDTNGTTDVYLRDLVNGTIERVSLTNDGQEARDGGATPSVSGDGRFVAFESVSSDLVSGDVNFAADIFVRDRQRPLTRRVSVADGNVESDADSRFAMISRDGTTIVFDSVADDLVSDDTDGFQDVFAHSVAPATAKWSTYGAGFPGGSGVPSFTSRADPILGTPLDLDVSNSSGLWTFGFLLVGAQPASLPTNLGGTLLVAPLLTIPIPLPPAGWTIHADLAYDAALDGISAFLQVLEVDPFAAHGASFTQGLELDLGVW